MNILFAASEAFPFIKTGGLGDVVHSLPIALNNLGDNVRLVLPAYRDVLAGVDSLKVLATWDIPGVGVTHRVRVMQAHQDELGDYLYLIDAPALFDRPGNPYVHVDGRSWPDNAERFTVFSRAVAMLSLQVPGSKWKPDVVHCHDWQTGLVPAFLSEVPGAPSTVFTIHNLSYDGYFSYHEFTQLKLPSAWWSPDVVEFYGGFSMLKAGMVFSKHVTTVSPTYAKEICTPEFGYRYDGILRHMGSKLTGILNGIDLETWNPETDSFLAANYTATKNRIGAKRENKKDLLEYIGLTDSDAPLLGFIGRMVAQKGVDLITAMLPELFNSSEVRMVILGSGDMVYESDLLELAKKFPDRLHVHFGYSEILAHKIEAGCDIFLMPSRFEPCGLNQMYSLRYGTPPIVHQTGGLADTVVNTTLLTLRNKTANGFVFYRSDAESLLSITRSALELFANHRLWQQVCRTAMQMDLGWDASARQYQKLYSSDTEVTV